MSTPITPITPARPFTLATMTAIAILGCAPQDGSGGTSGSSGTSGSTGTSGTTEGACTSASVSDAGAGATLFGRACLDTALAFAQAAQRCGGNCEAERTAVIRELAGGDCNSVSIRNEAELRTRCFPSLTRISCEALKNQRFDPSCAGQIIK